MSRVPGNNEPLVVDVVSDVVCPWCFLGQKRLEKAIEEFGRPVTVNWRPFQLDATIPPEGMDRKVYMERKFGAGYPGLRLLALSPAFAATCGGALSAPARSRIATMSW